MAWVKSEYAPELAVVSAWISALLPWSISYTPSHVDFPGTVVYVRFPLGQIRYIFDYPLADAVTVRTPPGAWVGVGSNTQTAYEIWLAALTVLGLAVALSFALYATSQEDGPDLERLEAFLPVPPSWAFWGLLPVPFFLLAAAGWHRSGLAYADSGFPVTYGLVLGAALATAAWLYVARYFDQRHLDAWLPGGPVRTMGALLVGASLLFAVASVGFYQWSPFEEWPIPIGVPITFALGAILLRVDLVEDEEPDDEERADEDPATA